MHIDDRRFLVLVEEVEAQGGSVLKGPCVGRELTYRAGRDHVTHNQESLRTVQCGLERRFHVPDRMLATDTGERGITTVCAEDDRMDLWPRFVLAEEEYA